MDFEIVDKTEAVYESLREVQSEGKITKLKYDVINPLEKSINLILQSIGLKLHFSYDKTGKLEDANLDGLRRVA